ncbi:MAG TPA: HlyD family efflux transporter periplasmic adaptor subunit, partial [Clostridia bacterium]|nr:HlyD family efflux transporter periplasmic adaptor subunit [Clostridia bacterium]
QPVAILRPVDPRAKLDLLQSALQMARLRLEPSLADQNALDFERLRMENLRLKQELAVAEVELQRAESALRRSALLRKANLVSEDSYELSLSARDKSQVEIAEKRKAINEIEGRLTTLRTMGEPESPGINHPLQTVLAQLDEKMLQAETNWYPVTLLAPISGMVHLVNRQPGEFAAEGEPLFTINSSRSDRIVGYLRQPYAVEPELGMKVEVVTRSRHRQKFTAEISQIGAQVETITNALAVVRPFAFMDAGLPIVVKVPPDVNVRPGEIFDILFSSPGLGMKAALRGSDLATSAPWKLQ